MLNLIDHLPRNSAYVEAMSQDEDVARGYLLSLGDEEPPAAQERLRDWSPERTALASIEDRLRELTAAVTASGGGKPGRIRYGDRPVTAMQKIKEATRYVRHSDLVSRVLPVSEGSS